MNKYFYLLAITCTLLVSAFTCGYKKANKVVYAEPDAVDIPASLFFNRDSVLYYAERAYRLDDPKGQFVVGACYYLRAQGDLPDYIYAVSHDEADSMLIFSAAQNYQPAINLIHCLHNHDCWRWEY